ncbi:hypothetical protein [Streptomyces goshikiensis]|uniref:hypothetical protein n=1 Tax=Streptomyces goshikiensis TaxID=1942 RepID=UPI00365EC2C6
MSRYTNTRSGRRHLPLPRRAKALGAMTAVSLVFLTAGVIAPAGAATASGAPAAAPVTAFDTGDTCKGKPQREDKGRCKKGRTPAAPIVSAGASVFASTNQTIPTDVRTRVLFSTAAYDTDGMFDAASSTLVVRTAGRYLLKGRLLWDYTVTPNANRELSIGANGDPIAFDTQLATSQVFGFGVSQEVSTIVALNVGDVISLDARQTTGVDATSVTISGGRGALSPQLQAERLAPSP